MNPLPFFTSLFKFRFLFLLPFLLLTACHKTILQEDADIEVAGLADYYLEFDISDINYGGAEMQDTTRVDADQDLDFSFTFKALSSLDRYLYFASVYDLSADSIALLGNIRFIQSPNSDFSEDLFDLEFVMIEALSNLTQNTDGTYNYLDRQQLAYRLNNENWGNQHLFGSNGINQMLLTLPVPISPEDGWGEMMVSSNGFYFQHETLELTEVTYLAEDDTIVIGGHFEVELKMLSCGFYSFYNVRQASFRGLIQ